MRRVVVAGLIWRDGRVLACQRRLSDRFPGKWEFPGGKLEPGETLEAALRRELDEELGIHAEPGEIIWRTDHQYPDCDPVELIFFAVRSFTGEPKNLAFAQMRWMQPADLLTLDFLEADLPLVRKLATT
ncbi:MAG: (deoxy)nucleoside triphosphate pyrophosphohydrolase [Acidobacteria bacterium]|nr:(deoxy)nucleoside triphosphate pyrophosphohydrolase [Acidobacteriota bacterium]